MLLRSELHVALNEVIVAGEEAADGHESIAEAALDEEIAEPLRAIAAEHRSLNEQLAERLRALGDLPQAPDTDWETVRELVARVKAALSEDERQSLLEDRAAAEAHLQACAERALERPELSEDTRALVEKIRDRAREAQARLHALAAAS